MARLLLIHGSCHGAWAWEEVLPHLRAAGHEATAIDLPGCGDDPTPPGQVTLQSNVDAILAAIDAPVTLVGHSLGGISITQAAEAAPDRIAKLVFVAAWVPEDGQSARDLRGANDAEALLRASTRSEDGLTTGFDPDQVEALFYHDCPPGTAARAQARLTPQPAAINTAPVRVTESGRAVPRAYIRCLADRAIPAAYQLAVSEGWEVRDLDCGHSPFFAQPQRLASHLTELAL